jgi:16S rRNA (guanine(966)-N(2))-methyltransferase RsmD
MSRPRGLRVIAGSARGRRLVAPEGDSVRPTKDIAREAMFSALDARGALDDAHVLDLYAGTGALAIEALSRGAATAVLVEQDRAALAAIRTNLQVLEPGLQPAGRGSHGPGAGGRAEVVARDVRRFLAAGPPAGAPFDLVFADPPYETPDDVVSEQLGVLMGPGWLAPDAIVSVERPRRHPVVPPPGVSTGWERTFGDTLLSFLFL